VSRNEIIERERRWRVPVGVTAIGAALLGFAGGIVQVQALDGADSDAAALLARNSDEGSFAAAMILQAASWFFLAVPFVYLFLAAAARSERVNRVLIGLFAIAPILLAVGSVLQWSAYTDVADQFVEERPSLEAEAEAEQGQANKERPPARAEEEEEEADPVEERAEELIDDSSGLQTAGSVFLGGLLGIAVGILYTCLQAMRVGLVSRFFGSLGMALSVAMILFVGGLLPAMLLFTVALGFLILGRWPGGRPPAWEAGQAVPWPKPGERPADSGRSEGDDQEEAPAAAGDERQPPSSTGSGPRRKRKRRR
jgi:hypothetical protein